MMPRFKLVPDDPLESERQAGIVNYLSIEPRVKFFIRVNGGGRSLKGGFVWFYRLWIGRREQKGRGVPDIIGQLRDGRFFALEVKRPDEKPTPEQAEFLSLVADAGGVAGVVCNWLDARKLLIMRHAE
jgi:hypothetical protein